MKGKIFVLAGPAGSGKDTVAKELLKRYKSFVLMVTATTRAMRPGEVDGESYYFFTNEQFLEEVRKGNILEYYHREDTDTYYGTYRPDIEQKLASGKTVISIVQIVGARYLKDAYDATTIFILPPSIDVLEMRVRSRAPMSDVEWEERKKITEKEIKEESPWYDYCINNEDGALETAIDDLVAILKKEGYTLE